MGNESVQDILETMRESAGLTTTNSNENTQDQTTLTSHTTNGLTTFSTGAVRSADLSGKRFDLIPYSAVERLSEVLHEGAEKYGENNWKKGMPVNDIVAHAIRHLFLYLEGQHNEDHIGHALCNLAFVTYFQDNQEKYTELWTKTTQTT